MVIIRIADTKWHFFLLFVITYIIIVGWSDSAVSSDPPVRVRFVDSITTKSPMYVNIYFLNTSAGCYIFKKLSDNFFYFSMVTSLETM